MANLTVVGDFTAMTTEAGTPSAPQSVSVSGTEITADIVIGAPEGFEVGFNTTTFAETITISTTGTVAATPVYARLKASNTVGTYSGGVIFNTTGALGVSKIIPNSIVSLAQPTIAQMIELSDAEQFTVLKAFGVQQARFEQGYSKKLICYLYKDALFAVSTINGEAHAVLIETTQIP